MDVLFFGPADFTVLGGFPGQFDHPRVHEAIRTIADAARRAGKHWGMPCGTAERAKELIDMGARFLCHGADIIFVKSGLEEIRRRFEPLGFTFDGRALRVPMDARTAQGPDHRRGLDRRAPPPLLPGHGEGGRDDRGDQRRAPPHGRRPLRRRSRLRRPRLRARGPPRSRRDRHPRALARAARHPPRRGGDPRPDREAPERLPGRRGSTGGRRPGTAGSRRRSPTSIAATPS